MIWIGVAVLALLAVAGIAAPWWWPGYGSRLGLRRRAANVAAYRGRLQELEADAAAGVVAADAADSARAELGARLVQDVEAAAPTPVHVSPARAVLAFAAVALPAFALVWYAVAGSWRTQALVDLAQTDPEAAHEKSMQQMIDRLREQVARHPDDADAWAWLARSLRGRGSYQQAADAFARASELKGQQDPDLLAEEGESLAFAQDRSMAGGPAARFAAVLALAPDHPKGLWYSGIVALQEGDDRRAIAHWEKLAQQELDENSRTVLEHSLAQLRERAGIPPPPTAAAPVAKAPAQAADASAEQRGAAGTAAGLDIEVTVAPDLADQVKPEYALFVYAQDADGPRMPLAVRRFTAAELPLRTVLDDSHAMMPARKLSGAARWRVIARISAAGSATPQSGDLLAEQVVEQAKAPRPLKLEIGQRLP